tara:strand:+ start:101 stop:262 length:162 start_codon:yes stop_codon:yes gene_type:complete
MPPGIIDLIILIVLFLCLQAWWILPIIKKNNDLNKRGNKLKEEIRNLEKIYKK